MSLLPPSRSPVLAIGLAVAFGVLAPLSASAIDPVGSSLVKDVNPGPDGSFPSAGVTVNGVSYFAADGGDKGRELWRSDGTTSGTSLVADIRNGRDPSDPRDITAVGNFVFFTADDGTSGRELWRSDGTQSGTVRVADIFPGETGSSPGALRAMGDSLYFAATTSAGGRELWKATGGQVSLVRDIQAGPGSSAPTDLSTIGSTLLFTADDGAVGRELWISDGSTSGTRVLKDLNPGAASSSPSGGVVMGATYYFSAVEPTTGRELWASDGTEAGTRVVTTRLTGGDLSPEQLTPSGGVLYFTANRSASGRELWSSDGTTRGTALVRDIRPGGESSNPAELTAVGNGILFAATDATFGRELWKSDGTSAGTVMVKDIAVGTGTQQSSSNPAGLLEHDDVVYFAAEEAQAGRELWSYDSSSGEASLASDVETGAGSSSPQALRILQGKVVFSASRQGTGSELHSIPVLTRAPQIATSTTLTGPSQDNYPVGATLTVRVSSASGTPDGTVVLRQDGSLMATLNLTGGEASYQVPADTMPGRYDFSADYLGTERYAASTTSRSFTVDRAISRTDVRASRVKVRRKGSVNFAITVQVPRISAPNGKLRLFVDGKKRDTVALSASDGGTRSIKIPFKLRGKHDVVVKYSGSDVIEPSASEVEVITVVR